MDNGQELEVLKQNFISSIDEEIARYTRLAQLIDSETNRVVRFFDDIKSEKERVEAQIKILEERKREIENGNYNLGAGPITGALEEKIAEKDELIDNLQNQVNALEQRKADGNLTSSEESIIDAQISYKQKMIEKLQGKKTKLSNRQKSIVMRKVRLRQFKDRMIAKQQVRVAQNENKVEELETKQNALGDSAIDALRENGLEARKNFHSWKAGFDRDVLTKLQNSRLTGIAGARAIAIGKVAIDRLRGRINSRGQNTMDSMMPPQPQAQPTQANTL